MNLQPNAEPMVFALGSSAEFGNRAARAAGVSLALHEERLFVDGEHKVRPMQEVAGRDVFVICGLHGDDDASPNDKLVRLLFFIGALKDAAAGKVTAVSPYLAYSRKDRRTKPRDPVSTRYMAALFESVQTDCLVTVEVHNVAAFENAFRRCRPEHVPVAGIFAERLAALVRDRPTSVVSPDAGGNKRAELLRRTLEKRLDRPVAKAIMDKHRSMGKVSGSHFAGDVEGRTAIIFDDIIASGTTILRAAKACRQAGAAKIVAVAPHGIFSVDPPLFGEEDAPDLVLVSDTIPLPKGVQEAAGTRIEVVEASALVGKVIARLHSGEPVSELLPYD